LKHVGCQRGPHSSQAMKRPGKKVADRSQLSLSRFPAGSMCCARIPSQRRASWQSGRLRPAPNLAEPTVSRLTYYVEPSWATLHRFPRFEKISACAFGDVARLCRAGQSRRSAFVRGLPRGSHARDRRRGRRSAAATATSMIYFGQSRKRPHAGRFNWMSARGDSDSPPPRWDGPISGHCRTTSVRLYCAKLREQYGSRCPRMRDGIERSGETVARYGFTISAGEWQDGRARRRRRAESSTTERDPTPSTVARPHSALRKIGCATILDLASWRW